MPLRTLTALPVYNEQAHIAKVLAEVQKHSTDILVVDDGSTDGTPQILAKYAELRIITHTVNLGYGAALRSAFEYATAEQYDVLVTIDCDGQHEPKLIPLVAAEIFPTDTMPVDIVSGSRYLKSFSGDSAPPIERRSINREITQIVNEKLDLNLTDTFCGFKAYRVESLGHLDITELGYAMPLQLWVQAARADLSIVEFAVPLVYLEEERSFGGALDDGTRRLAYYKEVLARELATSCQPCSAGCNGQ